MTEFEKYLKQAREDFAYEVSKYTVENNLALRTASDSLLIAFDQAVAKALRIGYVINWVACKDELPKNNGDYLVCKDGFVFDAGYSVEHKHFHDYEVTLHEDVTHWAELPKPPCL